MGFLKFVDISEHFACLLFENSGEAGCLWYYAAVVIQHQTKPITPLTLVVISDGDPAGQ